MAGQLRAGAVNVGVEKLVEVAQAAANEAPQLGGVELQGRLPGAQAGLDGLELFFPFGDGLLDRG